MTVQLFAEEINLSRTLSLLQQNQSFCNSCFFCTIMKVQLQ